ncbi:hypothetical protein GCM10022267_31100 [Lentzea roselyniae]|uniref:Cytochrome P450 n=1 Tax=Lentzea roselyniae TaxID=531940 RepID=A0ABP7AXG7_9PSEU
MNDGRSSLQDSARSYTLATAPGRLVAIGHALALARDPVRFLASLPQYADLVKIKLGPWCAYVLCHPDLIRDVGLDDRAFDKGGPFWDKARQAVGNRLASCPHQDHRRQRRLTQPAFRRDRMPGYARIMGTRIAEEMSHWEHGQHMDVPARMHGMAATIAARTIFATQLRRSDITRIQWCIEQFTAGLARHVVLPSGLADTLPTPANRRFRRAKSELRALTERFIAVYRAEVFDRGDLLSVLLAARDDDGSALSDELVTDHLVSFLVAGIETVANTLSWALYLLAIHPDIRERLHNEVDAVLGGRIACYEDLESLKLTRCVVEETLRLYPRWMDEYPCNYCPVCYRWPSGAARCGHLVQSPRSAATRRSIPQTRPL